MPGGGVVVAEEGNKRVGGPSAAELTQAVQDIKAWFQRAPEEWDGAEGAPSADLQRLEKTMETQMPHELELLLGEANGGLWFMEKESFSIDTMREKLMEYDGAKWWRPSLIPFAGDDSTLLIIDTKGGNGVFEWDVDESEPNEKLADSLGAFLEDYRYQLLGGGREYLNGCGVIEKVGASKK
jgi:cell wall assembly regulator SMI1